MNGKPLFVDTRARTVPHWLFRQLRGRDVGCRFPGCSRTRLVDVHHITFRRDGGATEPQNLALLCRMHHKKVHEGDWKMRGDPDAALEFESPTGKVLESLVVDLDDEMRQRLLEPALAGIT